MRTALNSSLDPSVRIAKLRILTLVALPSGRVRKCGKGLRRIVGYLPGCEYTISCIRNIGLELIASYVLEPPVRTRPNPGISPITSLLPKLTSNSSERDTGYNWAERSGKGMMSSVICRLCPKGKLVGFERLRRVGVGPQLLRDRRKRRRARRGRRGTSYPRG